MHYDPIVSDRIILINPPLSRQQQAGSLSSIANFIMPLGLGYVAAALREAGLEVQIIDGPPLGLTKEDIGKKLEEEKPKTIGFTATVLSIGNAIDCANHIRKLLPGTTLVIGGPHVSTLPKEVLAASPFDVAVIGEGELTACELFKSLLSGSPELSSIKGIAYKKGDEIIVNERRPYIKELDSLPLPARDLMPSLEHYTPMPLGYRRLPFAHLVTSRGCPHKCVYCDQTVFSHKYRSRSARKVVDEMEELVTRYGVRDLRLYDDLFTVRKDHVNAVCEDIIRRKLDLTWSCSTRVDCVTKEMMETMKKAGCWEVDFGLETGVPEMLESIKKGATIEQAEKAVRAAHEAGLRVRAFFVFGFPGETVATMRQTVSWATALPIDLATFYCVQLYPGSPLHKEVKERGELLHEEWDHYSSIIDTRDNKFHYVPKGLTAEDLKREVKNAYRSFYLRPSYMFRRLFSLRSWDEVKAHLAAVRAFFSL